MVGAILSPMDTQTILEIVLGLVAAWLVLIGLLWAVRPRDVAVSELVAFVPDLIRLVRALIADPRTERRVRVALVFLLLWLLSPIDLVPEFIPVLGPLDDVVVAVLVFRYVRRRLGAEPLLARWSGSEAGARLLLRLCGAN